MEEIKKLLIIVDMVKTGVGYRPSALFKYNNN